MLVRSRLSAIGLGSTWSPAVAGAERAASTRSCRAVPTRAAVRESARPVPSTTSRALRSDGR